VHLIPVARLTGRKEFILSGVRQSEVCCDALDSFVRSSRSTESAEDVK
jgi:hypothetical protein